MLPTSESLSADNKNRITLSNNYAQLIDAGKNIYNFNLLADYTRNGASS